MPSEVSANWVSANPALEAKPFPKIVMGLLALAFGMALFSGVHMKAWGFSFSPDSRIYVDVARNFSQGNGLCRSSTPWDYAGDRIPLRHLAPAYPVVMGLLGFSFQMDPKDIAFPLNLAFYVMNLWVMAWLTWQISGKRLAAVAVIVVAGFSLPVIQTHLAALTEPFFILLLLLNLHQFVAFRDKQRIRHLVMAAGLVGFMTLVRYQGLFLVPTGMVLIAFASQSQLWQRIKHALLYGVVSLLPILCWIIRTQLVSPEGQLRSFSVHLADYGVFWTLFNTPANWLTYRFFPQLVKLVIVLALLGGLIYCAFRAARNARHSKFACWFTMLSWITGVHIFFLVVVRSFFDDAMPFDDRILSSVYVTSMITVFAGIFVMPTLIKLRKIWVAVCVCVGVMVMSANYYHSCRYMYRGYKKSFQAGRKDFDDLPKVADLSAWQQNAGPVYSNAAIHVAWWLRKPTKYIPQKSDQESLVQLMQQMKNHGGIILFYDKPGWRQHLLSLETLQEQSLLKEYPVTENISLFSVGSF